jgi:hypothetical protein
MKEFRKDKDGKFVCEICESTCKSLHGLSRHIIKNHIIKEYYDKFIKEENEGICRCEGCKNQTEFRNRLSSPYKEACSELCRLKLSQFNREKNNLQKYNVKNVRQLPDIKEKIKIKYKKTCQERYGVDYYFQSEDSKIKNKEKWRQNYNVDNPSKSSEIKKKKEDTFMKHYNVKCSF